MKNGILIAGPWVGEFGWELFAWQAYVRAMSRHYDKTIVICRFSSRGLYEDFATEFIDTGPLEGLADSFFMHGVDTPTLLRAKLQPHREFLTSGTTVLTPRRIGLPPFTPCTDPAYFGERQITPEYITFGEVGNGSYDYVLHIRNRKLREEDNWSLESWRNLVQLLKDGGNKVACIGTKDEASWVEGTTDLRCAPLNTVFSVLGGAKCAFGPSSGPMHLASLCGTPHVVWSKEGNRERYQHTWNPLQTPVLFLSKHSWHPPADYVFEKFNEWRT